ncbi:hemerythrin domain-containing protein [Nitratireductor sp. StC3]|uniref:hemerythrin domain-containing protein n=1 Tax=Nitratireductor sp. StC3 TaxID=2126741 RepID=UPI0018EDF519|nr:hemerythrin domain-containing protein [Nitratireductor sp. StC3]
MDTHDESLRMALETLASPPPADQLAAPLDYLFAEHFRQRILCWMVDRVADAPETDRACAGAILRFLREDFGIHVLDEEEDLFPLIRRRAEPEDRVEDVLDELSQEHASDHLDATAIVAGLSARRTTRLAAAFRGLLHRFAANERRHLIVENAIVLPLARARLTLDDLGSLGRRMAARRGVDYPQNAGAARPA